MNHLFRRTSWGRAHTLRVRSSKAEEHGCLEVEGKTVVECSWSHGETPRSDTE